MVDAARLAEVLHLTGATDADMRRWRRIGLTDEQIRKVIQIKLEKWARKVAKQ